MFIYFYTQTCSTIFSSFWLIRYNCDDYVFFICICHLEFMETIVHDFYQWTWFIWILKLGLYRDECKSLVFFGFTRISYLIRNISQPTCWDSEWNAWIVKLQKYSFFIWNKINWNWMSSVEKTIQTNFREILSLVEINLIQSFI